MVDLQRPIPDKGMLFASGFKITAKIAIQMLCPSPIAVGKFSAGDSGENFIRSYLRLIGTASINVLLEPALLFEFPNEADGLIGRAGAKLRDDIDQCALHILCHPLGIAADIEMRALCKPGPQFATDLAHAILHVELLVAVARPRQRHSRQQAHGFQGVQFVGIEEIATAALMTEEQPVLAGRAGRLAVEQEGAERRDAGTGPDHDDRRLRVLRQAEAVRLLHIDLELLSLVDALAEEG